MLDAAIAVLFAAFLARVLDATHDSIVRYTQFSTKTLRTELVKAQSTAEALKKEMADVDMQTEFSKNAKLQRRYNKEEQIINKLDAQLKSSQSIWSMKVSTARRIFLGFLNAFLFFYLRSVPIFQLPTSLLWPFGWILALPMHNTGDIGIVPWFFMCRALAKLLIRDG